MKKKLIASITCLCMLLVMLLSSTLAWFTDQQFTQSSMTVGKVRIEQKVDTDTKNIRPNDPFKHTVTVKNSGNEDCYVRTIFAFEDGTYTDKKGEEQNVLKQITLNDGQQIVIPGVTDLTLPKMQFTIGKTLYTVGYYVYDEALAPKDSIEPLEGFALNAMADEAWGDFVGAKYDILVLSQACQKEGMGDVAADALDTSFGEITAANCNNWFCPEVARISTATELQSAIDRGMTDIILAADIELTESIIIPAASANSASRATPADVTIDLNGKTITGTVGRDEEENRIHVLVNNGNLVLKNGTVESAGKDGGSAIYNAEGAALTLENVTALGAPQANNVYPVSAYPSYAINNYGTLTVNGATVKSYHGAIATGGNGTAVINDVTIDVGMGNSTGITSYAIYAFEDGKVTINGGNFAFTKQEVYVNGGNMFCELGSNPIVVNGGNFIGGGFSKGDGREYVINGGTFGFDPTAYVAAGALILNNTDGTFTVVNNTTDGTMTLADGATLDLQGVEFLGKVEALGDLTIKGDTKIKTLTATNGGTITIEDGKTLTLNNFSFGSKNTAGCEYTITGGTVTANYGFFQHGTYALHSDFETGYMYYSYGSNITVYGTFHSQGKGDGLDYVRGNLTIAKGGKSIHDKSLWVGQPASWGAMNASLTVEEGGYVQANSLSVYEGSVAYNSAANVGKDNVGIKYNTLNGSVGLLCANSDELTAAINSSATNVMLTPGEYTLRFTNNTNFNVNNMTIKGLGEVKLAISSSEAWYGRVQGSNVTFENIHFTSSVGATGMATYNNCTFDSWAICASSNNEKTYFNNCTINGCLNTSTDFSSGNTYVKDSTVAKAEYSGNATMYFENCTIGELISWDMATFLEECVVEKQDLKMENNKAFALETTDTGIVYATDLVNGSVKLYDTADYTGTTLEVPEGVHAIGNYAFAYNNTIETVVLPETVTDLGRGFDSSAVKKVVLNEGLEIISARAFKSTTSLEEVVISSTVKTIDDDAFQKTGLKTITIPATVEYVGAQAFGASKIETVIFEGNITIQNKAFRGCANLRTVYINGDDITFENTTGQANCWFCNSESSNPNVSDITFYVKNETVAARVKAAMGADIGKVEIYVNGVLYEG